MLHQVKPSMVTLSALIEIFHTYFHRQSRDDPAFQHQWFADYNFSKINRFIQ